jgi:hypothetical protein
MGSHQTFADNPSRARQSAMGNPSYASQKDPSALSSLDQFSGMRGRAASCSWEPSADSAERPSACFTVSLRSAASRAGSRRRTIARASRCMTRRQYTRFAALQSRREFTEQPNDEVPSPLRCPPEPRWPRAGSVHRRRARGGVRRGALRALPDGRFGECVDPARVSAKRFARALEVRAAADCARSGSTMAPELARETSRREAADGWRRRFPLGAIFGGVVSRPWGPGRCSRTAGRSPQAECRR